MAIDHPAHGNLPHPGPARCARLLAGPAHAADDEAPAGMADEAVRAVLRDQTARISRITWSVVSESGHGVVVKVARPETMEQIVGAAAAEAIHEGEQKIA